MIPVSILWTLFHPKTEIAQYKTVLNGPCKGNVNGELQNISKVDTFDPKYIYRHGRYGNQKDRTFYWLKVNAKGKEYNFYLRICDAYPNSGYDYFCVIHHLWITGENASLAESIELKFENFHMHGTGKPGEHLLPKE